MDAQKTITCSGKNVSLFLLPASAAENIWRGTLDGWPQVAVSDCQVIALNNSRLFARDSRPASEGSTCTLNLLPGVSGLQPTSGQRLQPNANGDFVRFQLPLGTPTRALTWKAQQIRPAAPPRPVPRQPNGQRGREPNATDWQAAAVYNVTLQGTQTAAVTNVDVQFFRFNLQHVPLSPRPSLARGSQHCYALQLHRRRGPRLLR
jgi:hypothetical protein